MQLFDGTKIDFMGTRRRADRVGRGGADLDRVARRARLNYGIEFTGGVVIEATYTRDADLTAIRTTSRVRASKRFRCRTSARLPT